MSADISSWVREFHETYNCPIGNTRNPRIDTQCRNTRINLLHEEFQEYLAAETAGNIVEVSDALADMVYIIYGTALAYGIPLNDVLQEVHYSNMSKLDETGQPIFRADGKVLKGPSYEKPNISAVLFPAITTNGI